MHAWNARLSARFRRSVAAVALAAYAAISVFGGALVMCAEADGRVSFELLGSGCCDPDELATPVTDSSPLSASPAEEPACGGCDDAFAADLIASRAAKDVQLDKVPAPAELPAVALWTPAELVRVIAVSEFRPGPRDEAIPPPLIALRTVVLRC